MKVKEEWERRYREGFYPSFPETHWLLKRYYKYIKIGPVLEIAMGTGRDTSFMAEKGYKMVGLDISFEALKMAKEKLKERGLKNTLLVRADASLLPFKEEAFGGIVVFYFFMRDVVKEIKKLLKPGGVVIYETFLKRQNMIDRPRNPEFLLEDGELYSLFDDFEPIFYEEGLFMYNQKLKALARFVGIKR